MDKLAFHSTQSGMPFLSVIHFFLRPHCIVYALQYPKINQVLLLLGCKDKPLPDECDVHGDFQADSDYQPEDDSQFSSKGGSGDFQADNEHQPEHDSQLSSKGGGEDFQVDSDHQPEDDS